MNWRKVTDYCIESEDRRFRISRAAVGGSALYTRWRYADPEDGWIAELVTADANEAKAGVRMREGP